MVDCGRLQAVQTAVPKRLPVLVFPEDWIVTCDPVRSRVRTGPNGPYGTLNARSSFLDNGTELRSSTNHIIPPPMIDLPTTNNPNQQPLFLPQPLLKKIYQWIFAVLRPKQWSQPCRCRPTASKKDGARPARPNVARRFLPRSQNRSRKPLNTHQKISICSIYPSPTITLLGSC
jgi:hypothetical protein